MTPIVRCTLLFAAGMLAGLRAGSAGSIPIFYMAAGAAITAAMFGGGMLRGASAGRVAYAAPRGVLAALAFLSVGIAHGGAARHAALEHCLTVLPDDMAVEVHGTLLALPTPGATVPLAIVSLTAGGVDIPCHGTLRLRPRRDMAMLPVPGHAVRVHGHWRARPPSAQVWPARSERAGTLLADSIAGSGERAGTSRAIAARAATQARLRLLLPRHWPLAEALLLARREGLEPAVRERFVAAGLTHLLAISGTHVALFAGLVWMLCRMCGAAVRPATAAAALTSVAYVMFIGAPHAAARAALQLTLFSAARLLERAVDGVSVIAVAALVLLAFDPHAILEPGFQLSFAGVLGIVKLRTRTLQVLPIAVPHAVRDAFATGVAASATTMPIAALHFQHAAPIGLLAGMIAVPILACVLPALLLALALEPVAPALAAFVAGGAALFLALLDLTAALAARVPGGHAYVAPVNVLTALAAAGAYLLLRSGMRQRARERWIDRLLGRPALTAVGMACLLPLLLERAPGRSLDIHAIDVGQGDAYAIRSPRGRWILVDAGPAGPTFDAGARTVVPFLRRHGVRRVDILVLTHPHADHVGGARAVLDAVAVRLIVDPGAVVASRAYLDVIEAAARRRSGWVAARDAQVLRIDGVELEFLYPTASAVQGFTDPNDYSAVFILRYGRFQALFLGDAPAFVENDLVRRHGRDLAAALIKVGHHGSRTSTGDSLLMTATPSLALISAGRRNRYGHPTREVLERLDRHGVRTLRTDSAGTIRVRVRPSGDIVMDGKR